MLLFSGIDDRKSIVEHSDGDGVQVQSSIRSPRTETRNIVILYKIAKKGDIYAVLLHANNGIAHLAGVASR